MLIRKRPSRPATPVRASSPHSMMMPASKSSPARSAISIPDTPGKPSSGAGARSLCTTRASLPSARSASAIDIEEPIESPSGRECEETTNRRLAPMASTISWSVVDTWQDPEKGVVMYLCILPFAFRPAFSAGLSGALRVVMVGGAQFAEDPFDAVLARNRVVVHESQLRRSLETQARSQLPPEKRRGALERTAAR